MSEQKKTPSLEITGPVKAVGPEIDRNGFVSRKLWLDFDDSYERDGVVKEKFNTPEFEVSGKALEQLQGIAPGDEVKVTFNPQGFKWFSPKAEKNIVIGSNRAWRIEKLSEQPEPEPVAVTTDAIDVSQMNDDDDLPF